MKKALLIIATLAALNFTAAFAADGITCPTKLKQNSGGYWLSNSAPGWKSTRPSNKGVTLEAKNFGGAVLSVTKKRMVCIYRGSHGRWIGLLSHPKKPMTKSNLIQGTWKYNATHRDYICGKPEYRLDQCRFNIK